MSDSVILAMLTVDITIDAKTAAARALKRLLKGLFPLYQFSNKRQDLTVSLIHDKHNLAKVWFSAIEMPVDGLDDLADIGRSCIL